MNLGTCGGFAGRIESGEIILVDRTIVYDILELMGDLDEHLAHYSTTIDLAWLGEAYPGRVRRDLLVSGDRDLIAQEIPYLVEKFNANAGDWESGAIAWVAARNQMRLIVLRGVTDLVSASGSEAYGDMEYFSQAALQMMHRLVEALPDWLSLAAAKF